MHEIRHPSQYLCWLSRFDTWLPLPRLIFADLGDSCSGHYQCPWDWEQIYDGKPICQKRGIIAVNTRNPFNVGSTLAHEWRHHWQWFSGWENDSRQFSISRDYSEAIKVFFDASKSERDALQFERLHCPNEYNEEWTAIAGLWQRRVVYA